MSCNIINEYVSFTKKSSYSFIKYIMGKKFSKDIMDEYMDTYVNVRYYNLYEYKHKTLLANINYYMKEKMNNILNNISDMEKIIIVKDMLYFWKYIMIIDDVIESDSIDDMILAIKQDVYDRYEIDIDSNELLKMIKDIIKRKNIFLESFDCNEFYANYIKTNINKVFDTCLEYNLRIPKLYSNYAINKVFNSDIIGEDKLFILYYMVSSKILNNIISGIFDDFYLLDFDFDIFIKKDKTGRLFNIIDSDIVRECISFKVSYGKFLKYKDEIYEMMRNGYKFSCVISKDDKLDEIGFQKLGVFDYIIDDGNMDTKLNRLDNVIKVKW